MRQHKVFLRHELLKYNSEKSTAKSSALENYISSANLSLSGCSSAEPNSVSVGRCKFQLKKLYLQTVKKVDHLPIHFLYHQYPHLKTYYAPTNYQIKEGQNGSVGVDFPSVNSIEMVNEIIKERLKFAKDKAKVYFLK